MSHRKAVFRLLLYYIHPIIVFAVFLAGPLSILLLK